jgi:predicted enzyme related to lactoylglutathione lyase
LNPRAIDFVVHDVSDLHRAVAFYRDTLGLKLDFLKEEWGWAEFDIRPVSLALNQPSEGPPTPGSGAVIALAVDDVKAAVEELRGKGVAIVQESVETGVCFMAVIADPDGNRLWLHKRKDGTFG